MCIFEKAHKCSSNYHKEQKFWNLGHSTQKVLKHGVSNWKQNAGNEIMINGFSEAKIWSQDYIRNFSGKTEWKQNHESYQTPLCERSRPQSWMLHFTQQRVGCSDTLEDLGWEGRWEMAKEKCRRGGWKSPQWPVVAGHCVIACHSISFANFHKTFRGLVTLRKAAWISCPMKFYRWHYWVFTWVCKAKLNKNTGCYNFNYSLVNYGRPTDMHMALKKIINLCFKYTSKSIIITQTCQKKNIQQKLTWHFKWIGYFSWSCDLVYHHC